MTLAAVLILAGTAGCKGTKTLLPNVSGKAGEVMVVIDRDFWEGALGDEVRLLLTDEVPYLPQKEPLFNLSNVPLAGFSDLFRVHRNILLLQVDPQVDSTGIYSHKDVWASPQSVVQVSSYTAEDAIGLLKDSGPLIVSFFEQAERDRVIMNCIQYEESSLRATVNKAFGGSPYFPSGYSLKKQTEDFIWIGYDTQYTIQGIFIYRYPATGKDDMTLDSIIGHRNETLKANVPGMFENTYMTTAEAVAPNLEYLKYRGREFAQVRGFWEVHNDFMGGPFISHSFYSPDGKDIIVLEAFVYAPKYDKRNYLRQVESIIYSFEWADRQGMQEKEEK